jgi:Fur family ferric uptake transcriptional regulator
VRSTSTAPLSASACSAQDVYAEMRLHGAKIGLTTVYRALQALADKGAVDVLRTDDGESVYRACATSAHHHHLVCRRCGRTEAVGSEHGFTEITHTVEVFGTCSSCSAAPVRAG